MRGARQSCQWKSSGGTAADLEAVSRCCIYTSRPVHALEATYPTTPTSVAALPMASNAAWTRRRSCGVVAAATAAEAATVSPNTRYLPLTSIASSPGPPKEKVLRIFLLCTTFVRESSKSHSMALTKPLLSTPQGRGLGLPPRGVLGLAAVCGLLLGTKLPLRLVILLFPMLPHLGLTFCWCSGGRGGAQLCRDQSCSSAG